MGARVSETPLERPDSSLLANGDATLSIPTTRGPRRAMFRRLPSCSIPGYAPLCMDSKDPDTIECAFKKRLLRDVPPHNQVLLNELRLFVRDYLATVPTARILTFEEWLDSAPYDMQRKSQLRTAHESLRGGRPTKRSCQHVDTFVKSEFYETWKHARMINSRHDAFKAWSGPLFKAIEDVVYKIPEFIKHVPVSERASLISDLARHGRRYYQTDFTAFESHFTPAVLDAVECELYRHCLGWSEDAEFLCSVLMGPNKMRTRSGVRASVLGRRMSGDMCTSLGNGFTNLMLAKFLVSKRGGNLFGFVEGDDGLFATDVVLDPEDYARLGFTIKIEEVKDPCSASFCGMVFSESGQIIRNPRRSFMGFGWTQSFLHAGDKIMRGLLKAKSLSALYEMPHCPVFGALARKGLIDSGSADPIFVERNREIPPKNFSPPPFAPTDDTRLLFAQLYGVSVADQLAAESAIMIGDFAAVGRIIPPTSEQACYALRYVEVS